MKPRRWIERISLTVKDESCGVELMREHGFEVMARTGILPRIMREPVFTAVPFNKIDWSDVGARDLWDEFDRQKAEDRQRITHVKREIECERAFTRECASIRAAMLGPGGGRCGGGSAAEVLTQRLTYTRGADPGPLDLPSLPLYERESAWLRYHGTLVIRQPPPHFNIGY